MVDWDVYRLPPPAQEVASALLTVDPAERLGAVEKGGPRELKAASFFQGFDFVRLVGRTLPAPWVPQLSDEMDTRHCQPEDEIDIPEADVKAIIEARKNKELHTCFPEFELLDIDDAWDLRQNTASVSASDESFSAPVVTETTDPAAAPVEG